MRIEITLFQMNFVIYIHLRWYFMRKHVLLKPCLVVVVAFFFLIALYNPIIENEVYNIVPYILSLFLLQTAQL